MVDKKNVDKMYVTNVIGINYFLVHMFKSIPFRI